LIHRCPNRCHKCPDLKGEVMPGCMGTVVSANGPYDMHGCTCSRPRTTDRMDALESEVKKLKAKIISMEERLTK